MSIKLLVTGTLCISALGVAACKVEPGDRAPTGNQVVDEQNGLAAHGLLLFTDPITGCEYLARDSAGGGVTPRLNKAGQPMCPQDNVRSVL